MSILEERAMELYKQIGNVQRVAEELNVDYRKAYLMTSLRERGFNSWAEYGKHMRDSTRQIKPEKEDRQEYKIFALYLTKFLREKRKTQAWFGEQIGVTSGTVSQYKQGRVLPTQHEQEVLKLFGVKSKNLHSFIRKLKGRQTHSS
jgi:DNA-binding transcriptional regulator YiaG